GGGRALHHGGRGPDLPVSSPAESGFRGRSPALTVIEGPAIGDTRRSASVASPYCSPCDRSPSVTLPLGRIRPSTTGWPTAPSQPVFAPASLSPPTGPTASSPGTVRTTAKEFVRSRNPIATGRHLIIGRPPSSHLSP